MCAALALSFGVTVAQPAGPSIVIGPSGRPMVMYADAPFLTRNHRAAPVPPNPFFVKATAGELVTVPAGRRTEITGRGLEGIHLQVRAPHDRALNLANASGDAVAMFADQLRHTRLIQAKSAVTSGGKVILQAAVDLQPLPQPHTQLAMAQPAAEGLVLKPATSIDWGRLGGEPPALAAHDADDGLQLRADALRSVPRAAGELVARRETALTR